MKTANFNYYILEYR